MPRSPLSCARNYYKIALPSRLRPLASILLPGASHPEHVFETKSDGKVRVVGYTGAYVRQGATSSLGHTRVCVIDLLRPEADISAQYIWHERRRHLGEKCGKNRSASGVETLPGGQQLRQLSAGFQSSAVHAASDS